MRSDLKKLDYFTLEITKNHLFRSFLRNGRKGYVVRSTLMTFKNILAVKYSLEVSQIERDTKIPSDSVRVKNIRISILTF